MVRILVSFLFFCAAFWAHADQLDKLVIANSKAWKPFSYLNDKGKPDGILIEYWREYGEKNNVEIEFLLLDWQASIDAVKDGRADVHAGLLWSELRDGYLDYAPDILSIDTQLYISQELIGGYNDSFMHGGHQHIVGVVSGAYEEEFTSRHFPNLKIKPYTNNQLMINAAFSGEINAFIADLQVANFYLFTSDQPQRFIGVKHLYSGDLRAAVNEGNTELQQQITRGMNAFSTEDKQKIFNRWMYVSTVYPDYLVPIAALIIGVVTLGYIVTLNLTVKVRTRALQQANEELKYLAQTDQLTGLSNRHHFFSELETKIKASRSITVMIFDVDDFKQINDHYGHQVGDVVIADIAQAANQVLLKQHLIARVGGEEFAVVLANQTYERSVEVAEEICCAIRNLRLQEVDQHRVTVSLGCAYYPKSERFNSLSHADQLMYQSKTSGKDRVTVKAFEPSCEGKNDN